MSHVLVVDDDRDLAALVAAILERDGLTVAVAASLEEAQQQSGPWDLIIADVRLPNGDGRRLHAHYPTVPFLVMSGAPVDDPPEVATRALPFLPKPFTAAELRAAAR